MKSAVEVHSYLFYVSLLDFHKDVLQDTRYYGIAELLLEDERVVLVDSISDGLNSNVRNLDSEWSR